MLKELIIKDFFSFKGENHIPLNPGVNMLLGINGSGKTSFLNAIRLMYEGVCGAGFENLFQLEWGGFNDVVNANGPDIPKTIELTYIFDEKALKRAVAKSDFKFDVHYKIIIRPLGATGYTIEEKLFTTDLKGNNGKFIYLDFRGGKGYLSVYHKEGIKTENFRGMTSDQELVLRQISDPRRYKPMHIIRTAVSEISLFETFDTRENSSLRKPAKSSSEMRLSSDGENLVSVLNNLNTDDSMAFNDIEGKLRIINPNFLKFNFKTFGSRLYMFLGERNMRNNIGIRFISDGTLRYILMMSILMNPHTGKLIGMDEPEGRLHPDMINSLAEMLKSAATRSQVIVATHSPLLLNLFDIEDVLVFEKDKDNCSVVKQYYEEDFPEWEGEYLPGQMWLHGVIGGKRW